MAAVVLIAGSAAADATPKLRSDKKYAWSLGVDFAPVPLVTVGFTANATPRLAGAVRAGTLLLAYGLEIEARCYLSSRDWSPYVHVGLGAYKKLDPEASEAAVGPFAGGGVEIARSTGHYVAGFIELHRLSWADAATVGIGGGIALGSRW